MSQLQPNNHNGRLYIETVGCQMNVLDSELVVAALIRRGYRVTADIAEADTLLFNTCSVREHAEHKIYSQLGRLKYVKRTRPNLVIGVIGCMAQKDQELIFRRAPHVDMVVGTGQLAEIPRLIDESRSNRQRALAVSLSRHDGSRNEVSASFESYDPLREPQMRPTPFQAFVRIMIGCDKFCTYCVVPMTRGPEQSRPPDQIAREVDVLAGQGVKEITLLGQTVNSYRYTHNGKLYRLSDLLALIHDAPGIERIKFVTNFPRDMSDDLLLAVRDLPKVCRYLHVPVQSGCDSVLKLMKRGYTVAQYREMLARVRELIPHCAVSSDFIVGHPGETEESFQRSVALLRESRFKNSFIFKYSPRPGTKAFELYTDEVSEEDKRRRNNSMLALQNEISEEDNAGFIGNRVEVLVEGPSKAAGGRGQGSGVRDQGSGIRGQRVETKPTDCVPWVSEVRDHESANRDHAQPARVQLVGRTMCDRIVVFDGNPRLAGALVDVDVDDCTATTLIGRIVTQHVRRNEAELLPIL